MLGRLPLYCSVLHGREAKERIVTQWGTHSLVTAVRGMLREALQDPHNQRFLLMSGAPAIHPASQPASQPAS
jgi:hypothetical protein